MIELPGTRARFITWLLGATGPAPETVTVRFRPSANSHDANEAEDGTMYITSPVAPNMGIYDSDLVWVGFWIDATPYLELLPGSVVDAVLGYTGSDVGDSTPNIRWRGHLVDSPLVFTPDNGNISTRWLTTAYTDDDDPGVDEGVLRTVDVTAQIQEVTDEGGWTGTLALIGEGLTGCALSFQADHNDPTTCWYIDITFTGTGTILPILQAYYNLLRRD